MALNIYFTYKAIKRTITLWVCIIFNLQVFCQGKLFKGSNLLLPGNFIVDYVVNLGLAERKSKNNLPTFRFNPEDVKSVIFLENWYINNSDCMISKRVLGIAPVFYTQVDFEHDRIFYKKRIPFIVMLKKTLLTRTSKF